MLFNLGRHEVRCPHWRTYDESKAGSKPQSTGERYSNQLVGLHEVPRKVMYAENVGPSMLVDVQTVVQYVNEGESR